MNTDLVQLLMILTDPMTTHNGRLFAATTIANLLLPPQAPHDTPVVQERRLHVVPGAASQRKWAPIDGTANTAPEWAKQQVRSDEALRYDPDTDTWFGVRDDDETDWRNIRALTKPLMDDADAMLRERTAQYNEVECELQKVRTERDDLNKVVSMFRADEAYMTSCRSGDDSVPENEPLARTFARYKQQRDASRDLLDATQRTLDHVRFDLAESNVKLQRAQKSLAAVSAGRDDVWFWQGDGKDDLPSIAIVCPVVMSADTLIELLRTTAERDAATLSSVSKKSSERP